jgi:gluconokinase
MSLTPGAGPRSTAGCPGVIVVMGVAGAGKTTVGRALAAALGRAFHDADDFHPAANVARMRAGIPLTDADRAPWLDALRALVARCLTDGTPAVLACSALREAYRTALLPAGVAPTRVRFVFLDVTPTTAERRLAARANHYMPASLLDSQFATLEAPTGAPHAALRVDAEWPVDVLVAEARQAFGC